MTIPQYSDDVLMAAMATGNATPAMEQLWQKRCAQNPHYLQELALMQQAYCKPTPPQKPTNSVDQAWQKMVNRLQISPEPQAH